MCASVALERVLLSTGGPFFKALHCIVLIISAADHAALAAFVQRTTRRRSPPDPHPIVKQHRRSYIRCLLRNSFVSCNRLIAASQGVQWCPAEAEAFSGAAAPATSAFDTTRAHTHAHAHAHAPPPPTVSAESSRYSIITSGSQQQQQQRWRQRWRERMGWRQCRGV